LDHIFQDRQTLGQVQNNETLSSLISGCGSGKEVIFLPSDVHL